jgi:hypothetical protein
MQSKAQYNAISYLDYSTNRQTKQKKKKPKQKNKKNDKEQGKEIDICGSFQW